MEKTGELKAGVSRCDLCPDVSAVVRDGKCLCSRHAKEDLEKAKQASEKKEPLKAFRKA